MYLIGVCGPSCCGKDSAVQSIAATNRQVLHINCDMFFKNKPPCQYRGYENWEDISALHINRLAAALQACKNKQGYVLKDRSLWWGSYDCELLKDDFDRYEVVIFQGFLLFANKDISDQFDLKIFIDISDMNLLYRRVKKNNSLDEIDYIHDVVIPYSYKYKLDQKERANITFDSNSGSKENITSNIVNYLNSNMQSVNKIADPLNTKSFVVFPGDLLSDHEWHPIDFTDLKEHVQAQEEWMKMQAENIVPGNTFQYRYNNSTGNFEVRLSKDQPKYKHISRYTLQDTKPKSWLG